MGFEDGHYHSPVPDLGDLHRRKEQIWRPNAEVPGVDLDIEAQAALLESVRRFAADFHYPDAPPESPQTAAFFDDNGMFAGLDSRMHFCLLRKLEPRRIIEVGSGFSSLLAADVNRRYFGGEIEITCIEPNPRTFLKEGVSGISRLIESRVEEVNVNTFRELRGGDVLFIDSSHVTRTGNDVNFLFLEVLPRLAAGVVIHVHDVFFPHEYPMEWVLGEGRFWNEQYLVQALLMFSSCFKVLFVCTCARLFFPDLVQSVFGAGYGGSSLWMEKTG